MVRFHGLYQPIVLISTGGYSYCRANKNIQKFRKLSPASKNIQKFKSFHPRVSKNVEFQLDLGGKLLRSEHVLHNPRKVENNFHQWMRPDRRFKTIVSLLSEETIGGSKECASEDSDAGDADCSTVQKTAASSRPAIGPSSFLFYAFSYYHLFAITNLFIYIFTM